MSEWDGWYVDDATGRAHKMRPYEDEQPMTNTLALSIENTARWLEKGCDPMKAAEELRIIAKHMRDAVEPKDPYCEACMGAHVPGSIGGCVAENRESPHEPDRCVNYPDCSICGPERTDDG